MKPSDSLRKRRVAARSGIIITTRSTSPTNTKLILQSCLAVGDPPGGNHTHAFSASCFLDGASDSNLKYSCKSLHVKSAAGPTTVASVMGALFGLALVAVCFLALRYRKLKGKELSTGMSYLSSAGPEKQCNFEALESQNAHLNSQLRESNERANALQAALLAANSSSGPLSKFVPNQPRDDKQIGRDFEQITQEIKDYAWNHFRSPLAGGDLSQDLIAAQISPQLVEVIARVIPAWEGVLRDDGTKGKALVVRAAVWSILQKGFEGGEIFGKLGFEQRTLQLALLEGGNAIGDLQFWRRATFAMMVKSPTFNQTRNEAIGSIAAHIDQLLSPLAHSLLNHERYQFLYGIVQKASNLALELALQVADYRVQVSGFTLANTAGIYEQSGSAPAVRFDGATMDDITQVYQTSIGSDGLLRNAMEGRGIRGIISPVVLKWGNNRGENWGETTVVTKAQVLI